MNAVGITPTLKIIDLPNPIGMFLNLQYRINIVSFGNLV